MIAREIKHAKAGRQAHIIAKMNSLCDEGIIKALYEASAAGVKIQPIVRGICSLRTGIPGVSENIEVRSIVGNFLEHSRIFYFYNDGNEEIFMASADWMPRNLDRRVEILFPVLDEELQKKVKHILDIELSDTLKAHVMNADGDYEKIDKRGKVILSSQQYFCEEAVKEAEAKAREIVAQGEVEKQKTVGTAYKEGFDKGSEDGYKEGQMEVNRLIERLHVILEKTLDKRQEILDETEQQIVELVLLIARKVVKVISETQRNVVMQNILQSLHSVE